MKVCNHKKGLRVIYDSGDDSLTFITKKGHHTINTGLVLLTLDKKEEIAGIEIMGANKVFNLPKKVLNNLTTAKVHFNLNDKHLIINIDLFYKEKTPQKIAVPVIVNDFINMPNCLEITA